jgi:hypothetical protein
MWNKTLLNEFRYLCVQGYVSADNLMWTVCIVSKRIHNKNHNIGNAQIVSCINSCSLSLLERALPAASFSAARASQKLIKTKIRLLAAAPLLHIVHIKIFLLAKRAPAAKGQLVTRLTGVIIPMLDCLVGIRLILERDKPIVVAPLAKVETDVDNGAEGLEALPQVGLERSLGDAAHVDHAAFVYLPLLLWLLGSARLCRSLRAAPPVATAAPAPL